MLSRIRAIRARRSAPIAYTDVNYTAEHVRLAKTLERRSRILNALWARLGLVRYVPCLVKLICSAILAIVGLAWLFALPCHGLWKGTYIDEHAIQPAQVTMYFDWADVHRADRYLNDLERLVNGTFQE
jgi:glycosylphosphatidylinositol transamidase